eukprot:gene571-96_t
MLDGIICFVVATVIGIYKKDKIRPVFDQCISACDEELRTAQSRRSLERRSVRARETFHVKP